MRYSERTRITKQILSQRVAIRILIWAMSFLAAARWSAGSQTLIRPLPKGEGKKEASPKGSGERWALPKQFHHRLSGGEGAQDAAVVLRLVVGDAEGGGDGGSQFLGADGIAVDRGGWLFGLAIDRSPPDAAGG